MNCTKTGVSLRERDCVIQVEVICKRHMVVWGPHIKNALREFKIGINAKFTQETGFIDFKNRTIISHV